MYDNPGKVVVSAQDFTQAGSTQDENSPTLMTASDEQGAVLTEDLTVSVTGDFNSSLALNNINHFVSSLETLDNGIPYMDNYSLLDTSSAILRFTKSPKALQSQHSYSLPQPYHLKMELGQDWSRIFRLNPYTTALLSTTLENFVLRPTPMPTALLQSHSTRLIHMLRSIPRMMTRRTKFPPFIHPHWHHDLPEPLENCMTIAQLFCDRQLGNTALVWRTIRMEQGRLARGIYDFDAQELLAALQSYLVYMIMRVDDETGMTGRDVPMLVSFKVRRLMRSHCGMLLGK